MITLSELLEAAGESKLLAPGAPLSAAVFPGHGRVVVVTGANASGKSVFVQVLASRARKAGALPISISIRERTGAGSNGMENFRKTMMFGDESEQSTGATSVATVCAGFRNLQTHAQEKPSLLILDEPEMGLSEDYATAMGAYIAQQSSALSDPSALGVVVVSHSRALVSSLIMEMHTHNHVPHFVSLGAYLNASQWLAATPTKTIEDLLALPELGRQTRKEIGKLLR